MDAFIVDDPEVPGRKRRVVMVHTGQPGAAQGFVDGLGLEERRLESILAHSTSAQAILRRTLPARAAAGAPVTLVPDAAPGAVVAPMAGRVIEIAVRVGQRVQTGELLVTLEAMKTEQALRAPAPGVVEAVLCGLDAQVMDGDLLVQLAGANPQQT